MKKQRYIVEIEMSDGDFISAGWLKELIQTDCNVEDEGRHKVTVQETSLPSNLDEATEKEAEAYWKAQGGGSHAQWDKFRAVVKHFTEWQKEQKPVPKFSVGDYVKDTNYKGDPLYQIVGIDKECYICEYRGDKNMGDRAVMHFTFDNPYLRLEQRPAEWSEEDERMLSRCIKSAECSKRFANSETYKAAKDVEMNWLKALPERFNLQPKPEWSEEEKEKLNRIYHILGMASDEHAYSTTCRLIGDNEAIELQDFLRALVPPQQNPEDSFGVSIQIIATKDYNPK